MDRSYRVTLLQFGTALQGTLTFSDQAPPSIASGGVPTGNPISQSGITTTSPFSGNTAPLATGFNGGTASPSVAAFVVNSRLGTTTGNNTNNANTNLATNTSSRFAAPGTNSKNFGTFGNFGLGMNGLGMGGLGLNGGVSQSGTLTTQLNGEALIGSWQAFDLGGDSVWFAQASGNSSFSAWGMATPESLVGWASVQTIFGAPDLFGSLFPTPFPQTYLLFGQAVDVDIDADIAVR